MFGCLQVCGGTQLVGEISELVENRRRACDLTEDPRELAEIESWTAELVGPVAVVAMRSAESSSPEDAGGGRNRVGTVRDDLISDLSEKLMSNVTGVWTR